MNKYKDIALIIIILYLSLILSSCDTSTEPEYKVEKPVISPKTGAYEEPQEVTISCSTEDVTIRYTIDGSMPNSSSQAYSFPIMVYSNTTIIAQAFKEGWDQSDPANESYVITKPVVATPVFSIEEGTYYTPQSVTISCATDGAVIRYTIDGSAPTPSSNLYDSAIQIDANLTLQARAFKNGCIDSEAAEASYFFTVTTPILSPGGGVGDFPLTITFSCTTENAKICYTTDGSMPTNSSNLYTSPIQITSDTEIKAKAYKDNWFESELTRVLYISSSNNMIYIPGGTFIMGRTKGMGLNYEYPTHSVTLNSFYISRFPITQGEYEAIMSSNPALSYGVGSNYPVYYVNWYDAIKYCNLRSMSEGLTPVYSIEGSTDPADWGEVPYHGDDSVWAAAICDWNANGYRLPTEAEWEYVARAGTNDPDYLYSGSDNIEDVAWYNENSDGTTHPVAEKTANGLNIYDLTGNVMEWCWDWYDPRYYIISPSNNPTGPANGNERVIRGGSFHSLASYSNVSGRSSFRPIYRHFNSFRVCRTTN